MPRSLAEADARAEILLTESDPRRTVYPVGEWEESLGLPDTCTVGVQTIIDRQLSVVSKLTDRGGARATRYIKLAAKLGYPGATITRYRYHTCEMTCESAVQDIDWRFARTLTLPSGTRIVDSVCESGTEDPLSTGAIAFLSASFTAKHRPLVRR
ncbi:putative phage tail protein [Paludibacterium denitrificans]|uniref:putative phage tail protein n=1 Tax=Paludibacterium denitrificans TaxID=2675226 RepID=UPI001E4B587A